MAALRTVIMGAAGRDFHNFNVFFRDQPAYEVVAFTAAQIPNIEGRVYPALLAGPRYPQGIPIVPEEDLERLLRQGHIELVVFAYSDVAHEYVMHKASQVLAAGADFILLGPRHTQLQSRRQVVAVTAVRTGAGKSPTSRHLARCLRRRGQRVVTLRHPMPYGDLARQAVQRFAAFADLDKHQCTIEEREEYEPILEEGGVVYAGVDYERILRQAEEEADVVMWDGGNNDFSFLVPDLHMVVVDPHRAGQEASYHPGEANVRAADAFVINKVDTASPEQVRTVEQNLQRLNPGAAVFKAASPPKVPEPEAVRGRRVLVVEDGPTLTHGGMAFGAGYLAARALQAHIVDPRPCAVGALADTFRRFPHLGPVLPAMGYGPDMMHDLEQTINRADVDVILVGTPCDLGRFLQLHRPYQRVRYELEEQGPPWLEDFLFQRLPLDTGPS